MTVIMFSAVDANKCLAKDLTLNKLEKIFRSKNLGKRKILKLKRFIQKNKKRSVPVLIRVMKSSEYPERNRWMATFWLGKSMGKQASPFLSKFVKHPNWLLRVASLKVLLALREKKYGSLYGKLLKDPSLIVRTQALENIRQLKLHSEASKVWRMLYDRRNYYVSKKKTKRGNIIKDIIRVVGDLNFQKAKKPLLKMILKERYTDIFSDIEYSLRRITGKVPPKGNRTVKKIYWQRLAISETTI